MLPHYLAVRPAARRIAKVLNDSVTALRDGRVEQEPAMTDRMLGALEQSFRDTKIKGIVWTAKTLTDRGGNAQEPVDGADFMGVLDINLPDYKVSKGFLAQAKLVRGQSIGSLSELRKQCKKMLKLTPSSYVFLYSPTGIRVVPADAVVASNVDFLDELYSRSGQRFFEEHLQCFIGDTSIKTATPATLKELREKSEVEALKHLRQKYKARNAFVLIGKASG